RSRAKQIVAGMQQAMGPQAIKLYGVPESSGFALKIVAADYRLKRIALAHDRSPVPQVKSYLDLAAARYRGGPQTQHRWWFLAKYDAIRHSDDRLAFALDGQGVQVVTAPSFPGESEDQSKDARNASGAAEQFAAVFTRHFPAIAEKVPVFQELENLIDLAVVAELIRQQAEQHPQAWRPTAFLDDAAVPLTVYTVPGHVPSMFNVRLIAGRHWLISISGGVEINPASLVTEDVLSESPDARLDELRKQHVSPAEDGRWWWD
ncbi:MAG: DUF1598 domain-containing protein, partial [Planctomycetaceae bacterium]